MHTVIWSAFAEQQIDDIFEYHKLNASLKVATEIVIGILQKTEILITNPDLGAPEELLSDRKEQYRFLVYTNYKIIYSVDEHNQLIKIADVFDTRQNPIKISRGK